MSRVEFVRTPNPDTTARNLHKVPVKQWRKWGDAARRVFNYTYAALAVQWVVKHPSAPTATRSQWSTLRWNAAWLAADGAQKAASVS